jgi:L-fuculose-phosphate aldolase
MSAGAITEAKAALVEWGRRMTRDRLAVGTAGNLSIRVGDTVVMTPSGVDYDEITESMVCVLGLDGQLLDGSGQRSSEWPMHNTIYQATQARAIVHAHSPFAVAVSAICDAIPAIHYSVLRLGGPTVRVAPYATFGSDELASVAMAALDGRVAALLQNHGTVAYGPTLAQAYDRAQLTEWIAEVYWRAAVAGSPRILTQAELDEVSAAARRHRYAGGQS